jgi:hypothetical protein
MALDIWVGSKLCATEKSLVGTELLGMEVVRTPGLLHNLIPVPPKIDNQMDAVVINWMIATATRLMGVFSRKLVSKKGLWFEIFLTIFILINNIEYVYGVQEKFASMFLENVSLSAA